MNKTRKVVFWGSVARLLLQKGYKIIDVVPHKEDRDKSVFVFENVNGFDEDMQKIIKQVMKN
jgi:DNA-directed RNA polymerase subunit F